MHLRRQKNKREERSKERRLERRKDRGMENHLTLSYICIADYEIY